MRELTVGRVRIQVWPDTRFLQTVFECGVTVPAAGNADPASIRTAGELGYGWAEDATWHMSMEHEALHSWIAVQQGGDWSPTLHSVAHGYKLPRGIIPHEENMVMALQKYLNTTRLDPALVDLVERARCPLPDLAERARAFLAQFGA